ncbi:MAG: ATP-dependent DNA helicase [Lachnospiraceae bacterium]|nr:ATP-dependent DNA helicase [Lachnospiraceae bacterium]
MVPEIIKRGQIKVSVRNLVEFILRSGDIDNRKKGSSEESMAEGARIHRLIQSRMGPSYHAEVPLREIFPRTGYDIVVEGRADGIIYEEKASDQLPVKSGTDLETEPLALLSDVTVDEIKSTWVDIERIKEPKPVHIAQARCYAYIFAKQHGLKDIRVRITYVNLFDQQIAYFHEGLVFSELKAWFDDLLSAYGKWADFEFSWNELRNRTAALVGFPFEYRKGQKELISQVYRTIYHKRKLFLEAPTGTGKTISTVFPAVKAIAALKARKIFYLTAKTITRTVAMESFDILREGGLRFKTVQITAKEKVCPAEEMDCNPVACPYAKGHYDRINEAIFDLLTNVDNFSRDTIEEYSERHMVCPFELSLDMSLFADAVICDYNYVFDPNVFLRRFFSDSPQGEYIFLVDEAHNLVDRAMKMYSAELLKEDITAAKRLVREHDNRLSRALDAVNRKFLLIKRETEKVKEHEDITDFIMALNKAYSRLNDFLEDNEKFEKRAELLEFYFKIRHFINMYDGMGKDDYVIYSELLYDGRLMLKLLCIDPSENLKVRLSKGVSTVFFSATLLPVKYYRDMLGADREDYAVYAESVFDEKKRGLFIASDVSSRYTRRGELEYQRIAEYISAFVNGKIGNYMVFFPSYSFLSEVLDRFVKFLAAGAGTYEEKIIKVREAKEPADVGSVRILCQKSSMTEEEREAFLNCFTDAPEKLSLVGFCVAGGIFSEGIDLKKDSLIGAAIVGTGLPMVCNERELMKKNYDRAGINGFDYAYRFPGMNKVLQAAGRVIRTADDVGIVALLDERFLSGEYKRLFPREWSHYEVLNLQNKEDAINDFWEMIDMDKIG